jgi:Tol biopolymer transport system component
MDHLTTSLRLAAASSVVVLAGCTTNAAEPAGSTAAPEPAGPHPLVLFQAWGPTRLLAGTARLDGSGFGFVLEDLPGGDQTNPDWSPDGDRIVLAVHDGVRDDLWVADADGGHARLLLDCEDACSYLDDPAWSPDGTRVVYSRTTTRGATGLGSLETVDVDTGAVTVLVPPRFRWFTAGARWSPDGSKVVFESVHTDSRRLSAEVDGVALRILDVASRRVGPELTDPLLFAATADWSPDGARIAYSARPTPRAEAADLFVVPAAGGTPQQVTDLVHEGGYADEPTWLGDGTLVFSGRIGSGFGGSGVLLQVDASGGPVTELGTRAVTARHPRIEPGG